ncbi:MAG: YiiD C-terminal domain-containing protein [Chthoniobacterales bacterium]
MTQSAQQLRAAEEFFHLKIPLTRAMGVRVAEDDENGFAIEAPVAMNHNHLHTAFGGSINAVATLAAYGFLWLELRDSAIELVVAESSIRFIAPIRQTIRAVCLPVDNELITGFKADLAEKGKSRIRLHVRVEGNGVRAADFAGTFVALRKTRADHSGPA